ncbi:MAG: acetyltransferase [Treponema sp.]|nr:acetyltransferase [Treponema sp.]
MIENSKTEKPIIIIGAGGHAKVLFDVLRQQNRKIIGFVDKNKVLNGTYICGIPVLGNDEVLNCYNCSDILLVNGIGSVGSMELRKRIYNNYKKNGFCFETVVHNSAVISSNAILEEGCQILAGAVLSYGCKIGANSIINTKASVDHECIIGRHVHIAPGCTICGGVAVGNETHVGSGSTVIQLCKIGSCSLIGAGSLVLKDIPANARAYGSPANAIKVTGGGCCSIVLSTVCHQNQRWLKQCA